MIDCQSHGGDAKAQCGLLKDHHGMSWQVVPTGLTELLKHPDPEEARRAMAAMPQMKKIDLAQLRKAAG